MDDIRVYYPYYWPSQADPKIVATKPSTQVIIQDTVTGAVITFYQYVLCVQVRTTPFFYGNNTMCGVFGSIDDVCTNDIRASNGTTLPITDCNVQYSVPAIEFEDTWITNTTVDSCVKGAVIHNNSNCVSLL
uniref:Uncharacterized protein n=1 Tax=Panagrolaimus davidi TaxID=227884 RepID=A0A914PM41_9BILA